MAIERAAVELGVEEFTDTMTRIAGCESMLQPAMTGFKDPTDIGLFQWNENPPRYQWSTTRQAFNT